LIPRASWLLILCAVGCYNPLPTAYCTYDSFCLSNVHPGGRCLFDGDSGKYCAFPDSSCPSGYRWNEFARRSIAELCIDPVVLTWNPPPDASTGD